MKLNIQKARRYQKKAKITLIGPAGSGKTLTGLKVLRGLVGDAGKILCLDSERSSATLYADHVEFDHADLPDYEFETYMEGIQQARANGYEGLLIDSVSPAWEAFLELHDLESARTKNSFTAWSKITPKYNALINAIISYAGHVVVTMRAKTEYVMEERNGKQTPKRVGLAAVMRPGSEYEFDVVGLIDIDHNLIIEKTRFDFLADKIITKPDEKIGAKISEWLSDGEATKETPKASLPEGPFYYDFSTIRDEAKLAIICGYMADSKATEIEGSNTLVWVSETPLPRAKNYLIAGERLNKCLSEIKEAIAA